MRVAVILNPRAGVHRHGPAGRAALARELLEAEGMSGDVIVTTSREHTRAVTRSSLDAGAETVVAWGGDGTINQVASELIVAGNVALGIVPAGSGNGLARELGIERDPRSALRTALRGRTRTIDVGELAGQFFFNVAGAGLDAHLARTFELGRRRGLGGYVTAVGRELGRYRPQSYTITAADGGPDVWPSGPALIVAVANTRQYGNQAVIAPLARPDDGLLELVVVPPLSLCSTLWHARRLFTNSVHRVPGVRMCSVRGGEIRSDEPLTFHVDGEVATGASTLSIAVHPGRLAVRVPPV